MGVAGLLPVLKSVTDQVHVSKYAGKTVGVDASSWLYKGAYSCPVDLVLGKPTDAYLNFSIQHIKLLQDNNITPIMVFDGAPLPSKGQENIARGRSRVDWRRKAKEMLQQPEEKQDGREIFKACTRGVSVTNEMVMRLIATLRRMNITFYVAPYEADAQLAFLSKQKIVDVVISEDSDCVPYGVRTALLKLQPDGWGTELKRRSLGANEELSFVGWTEEMFIQLCVLAGCDYCRSVPGVGIMTAYKLVNQYKTPTKILKALQQQKGSSVPEGYAERFYSAILTYRHQLVFDPRDAVRKTFRQMLARLYFSNLFSCTIYSEAEIAGPSRRIEAHSPTCGQRPSLSWQRGAPRRRCCLHRIGPDSSRHPRKLCVEGHSGCRLARRRAACLQFGPNTVVYIV
eukprot:jgi/Phyca11/113344/e_gw1.24.35.1